MRGKDTSLPFKTEDGSVDIWLLQEHTGVISQVTRGEIIRAVDNNVVGPDQIECIVRCDASLV